MQDLAAASRWRFAASSSKKSKVLDRVVLARADDDSLTALGYENDFTYEIRVPGDGVNTVVDQLRGVVMTEHRKPVQGGLLTIGYTLWHPFFPRGGTLYVDCADLDQEDLEFFPQGMRDDSFAD